MNIEKYDIVVYNIEDAKVKILLTTDADTSGLLLALPPGHHPGDCSQEHRGT